MSSKYILRIHDIKYLLNVWKKFLFQIVETQVISKVPILIPFIYLVPSSYPAAK